MSAAAGAAPAPGALVLLAALLAMAWPLPGQGMPDASAAAWPAVRRRGSCQNIKYPCGCLR